MNLFIAFSRSGQKAGSFINTSLRGLICYLCHHMTVGNGEYTCTKQVHGSTKESEEYEIMHEVETRLGIGEDVCGEKG